MPHHIDIKLEGRITDVFGHRFVIEQAGGQRTLADVGPEGSRQISFKSGDVVSIEGEMKPTEIKVSRLSRNGEAFVAIAHHKKPGPKHHDDDLQASPTDALRAVTKAGIATIGEPRRKPKHFEVLGRRGADLIEVHVEFDGHIRKEKAVAPHEDKWSEALKHDRSMHAA